MPGDSPPCGGGSKPRHSRISSDPELYRSGLFIFVYKSIDDIDLINVPYLSIMMFSPEQVKAHGETIPTQEFIYMMSSQWRDANRVLNIRDSLTDVEEKAWIEIFQREIVCICDSTDYH